VAALRSARDAVREELGRLSTVLESASVAETAELVTLFDALNRASSAGMVMAAHRAEQLEAFAISGHRNAPDWLAGITGTPFARAKECLALGERMELSPAVRAAFTRGELSTPQAEVIGEALAVVPSSGEKLLGIARESSHRELTRQVEQMKQAARSQEDDRARRARAYRRRSLRFSQLPEGGVRVQVQLTEEAWGRCLPVLEHSANLLFRQARSARVRCSRDQYLADAFVDIVSGRAASGDRVGGARFSTTTMVRVDAAALRRGSLEPGETCEIAGVGPVSVDTARELLGEGWFRLLVTDGADVTTMTSRTRSVRARIETALLERDRTCVVPGCDVSIGLETHHWRRDYALDGPTELDNLCRICSIHHDMASSGGWRLAGGPGAWSWEAPSFPVSPRLRSARRQIAAARGRSPTD
jgi:hypothetical protein